MRRSTIFALLYSSVAVTALDDRELTSLLSTSRRNNEADGLTGLLLHVHGGEAGSAWFVQLLEGEQAAVERTFERIARDELHDDVRVLHRGPVAGRRFAGWTMRLEQILVQDMRTENSPATTDLIRDPRAMNDLLEGRYA
jgi:Sensors of blue-light using FAD